MIALKSVRTLAASLGVLAIGALAASPAMAFDKVDWDWEKDIKEKVDIDAYIDLKVDITGMVEVEKLQIFLGTVKAESIVHGIDNNPFYKEADRHDDYYVPEKKKHRGDYGGDINIGAICYAYCIGLVVDWDKDGHKKDDGWDKIPVKPLDATTQLPIVLSSATAVGNNQSITSDVPVFLHDAQFVADVKEHRGGGGWDNPCEVMRTSGCVPALNTNHNGNNNYYGSDNAFVKLALDFLKDAKNGDLKHAEIKAKSIVYDIKNASVDSSATAVANNISVTLASNVTGETAAAGTGKKPGPIQCIKYPCNPGGGHNNDDDGITSNHIVIADITQFALANVEAKSHVTDVSATGYKNMRQLTTDTLQTIDGVENTPVSVPTPWISSVATAVGNNVSISVGKINTNYEPPAGGTGN